MSWIIKKTVVKNSASGRYPSSGFKVSAASSLQHVVSTSTAQTDSRKTQVGVYLTIPLYSGGAISSKAREEIHNYDKVPYDIENAKLGIQEDIEGNYTRWKLAIAQTEALEKAIVSSEAALKSVNTGYALGGRIGLDVFTAQQQVIQLKIDLLKEKYETLTSLLKIRTALGQNHANLFRGIRMLLRTFIALILSLSAIASHAQRRENPDAVVLNRAKLVNQTDRVEVYRDDVDVEDSFGTAIDQLYAAIETQLGRKFEAATLGKRIKVVVSNHVRVSHVWRGYQHMSDPQAVIFLNARAYNGFKSKSNATLVHEMTHLFTWKYNSHSLREGIADYVARAVMPNTAIGPNEANAVAVRVDWAFKYLGSNHPAPPELTTDLDFRKNYYFSSYVIVKALIERTSMADFLRFYDGTYSDALFESTFQIKRLDLICELKLGADCRE